MNDVTELHTYRLPTDEFDYELLTEEEHPLPFSASEIQRLERIGIALTKLGSTEASWLLAKCLLWRATRKSGE